MIIACDKARYLIQSTFLFVSWRSICQGASVNKLSRSLVRFTIMQHGSGKSFVGVLVRGQPTTFLMSFWIISDSFWGVFLNAIYYFWIYTFLVLSISWTLCLLERAKAHGEHWIYNDVTLVMIHRLRKALRKLPRPDGMWLQCRHRRQVVIFKHFCFFSVCILFLFLLLIFCFWKHLFDYLLSITSPVAQWLSAGCTSREVAGATPARVL